MTVDAIGQARFNIVDANGTKHYACCPICALRLIKTYGELNITSFCDYNGQSYPIIIRAKQYGSIVTVNPSTAIVLLGVGVQEQTCLQRCGGKFITGSSEQRKLTMAIPHHQRNSSSQRNSTRVDSSRSAIRRRHSLSLRTMRDDRGRYWTSTLPNRGRERHNPHRLLPSLHNEGPKNLWRTEHNILL